MNLYKIRLNEIDNIKKFTNRIANINSKAFLKSEDEEYRINAKSIMGIFSLDLSNDLILEIKGDEEEFIKDIGEMGIYIEPISVGV